MVLWEGLWEGGKDESCCRPAACLAARALAAPLCPALPDASHPLCPLPFYPPQRWWMWGWMLTWQQYVPPQAWR
jgi:hypothetical protein